VYRRPTLDVIAHALGTAGVESIDENGGGPSGAAKEATPEKELGFSAF
jgi:hypothetical protein